MDVWAYYLHSYKKRQRDKNIFLGILLAILIIIIVIIIAYHVKKNRKNKLIIAGNCENIKDIISLNKAAEDRLEYDTFNEIAQMNRNKIYYSDEVDPIITGRLYREWGKRPIYTQRTSYGDPVWETQNISKFGKIGYTAPRGLSEYNSAHYYNDVGVTPYIWRDGKLSNQDYNDLVSSIESYDPNIYNNISKEEYDFYQKQKNINNIAKDIIYADDGIPQNWNLPSTPILNYNMTGDLDKSNYGGDYYGVEGATPFTADGIATMFTPDHEPGIN